MSTDGELAALGMLWHELPRTQPPSRGLLSTSFAALLFRPSEVPDAALSRGFAVALAGWDVPAPPLRIARLPGFPGWSAAFYTAAPGSKRTRWSTSPSSSRTSSPPRWACSTPPPSSARPPGVGAHARLRRGRAPRRRLALHGAGLQRRFVREGDEGSRPASRRPRGARSARCILDLPGRRRRSGRAGRRRARGPASPRVHVPLRPSSAPRSCRR